jgi:hypothetical protein
LQTDANGSSDSARVLALVAILKQPVM